MIAIQQYGLLHPNQVSLDQTMVEGNALIRRWRVYRLPIQISSSNQSRRSTVAKPGWPVARTAASSKHKAASHGGDCRRANPPGLHHHIPVLRPGWMNARRWRFCVATLLRRNYLSVTTWVISTSSPVSRIAHLSSSNRSSSASIHRWVRKPPGSIHPITAVRHTIGVRYRYSNLHTCNVKRTGLSPSGEINI